MQFLRIPFVPFFFFPVLNSGEENNTEPLRLVQDDVIDFEVNRTGVYVEQSRCLLTAILLCDAEVSDSFTYFDRFTWWTSCCS